MTPGQGTEEFKSDINTQNPFYNIKEEKSLFTPPNSPANGSSASLISLSTYVTAVTSADVARAFQETSLKSTEIPTLQHGSLPPHSATEQSFKQGNISGTLSGLQETILHGFSEKPFAHGVSPIGRPTQPPSSSVIPPPPMFSSQARSDSQPNVGKTILPPSVARRITSNHPYIKPHLPPTPYTESIFVPTPITDVTSTDVTNSTGAIEPPGIKPPSAFAPYSSAASQSTITPSNVSQPAVLRGQETSNPISIFTSGSQNISPSLSASLNETIAPPPMFNPASMQSVSSVPFGTQSYLELQTSSGPVTSVQAMTTVPTTALSSGILQSGSPVCTSVGQPKSIPSELPESSSSKPIQSLPCGPGMPPRSSNISIALPPTVFASMAVSSTPAVSTILTPTLFTPANICSNVPAPEDAPLFFTPNIPQPEPNLFFNPSVMESQNPIAPPNISSTSQLFNDSSAPDPPKQLTEPPKATGIVNYRMTKKRPQYYSGPIEGVGAISNNVKPVIQLVESGAFQGNLFTPQQSVPENQNTQTVEQIPPFDLNQPTEDESPFASFEVNQQPNYNQSDYNTAFDFSRPTAERFEPPKQETKGFGLIGSLKSKLSSLDINKIQSSVTTFFDPAYNSAQKEPETIQENDPYVQQQPAYGQYGQSQNSNFEIFVPNIEQSSPQYNQNYGYQHLDPYNQNQYYKDYYQNQSFAVSAPQESDNTPTMSVPQFQTAPANYGNENVPARQINYEYDKTYAQNVSLSQPPITSFHTSLGDIGKPAEETNLSSSQPYTSFSNKPEGDQKRPSRIDIIQSQQSDVVERSDIYRNDPMESKENAQEISLIPQSLSPNQEMYSIEGNEEQQKILEEVGLSDSKQAENKVFFSNLQAQTESALSFFDMPLQSKPEEMVPKVSTSESVENVENLSNILEKSYVKDSFVAELKQFEHDKILPSNPCDFFSTFEPVKSNPQVLLTFGLQSENVEIKKDQGDVPLELSVDLNPDLTMSSAPLFGLSTMLAIKTKELIDLENDMKTLTLHGTPKEIDSIFNRDTNASFFENIGESETQYLKTEEIPELNICETCREVNRPEDRDEEADDVTTQLIENINSPIQLSNPVEAPLTESDTPVEGTDIFERHQCEEISHITEDTIETLQVQSATELLDDDSNNANTRAYGWSIEERPLELFKTHEHDYNVPNAQVPIGFFGNNSLFTNASDEIKAEFYCHEESPAVLSKQMSIPSAPPEEDLKIDEAGLDVHSIEQDAKDDFPIFEEFVIEPSETDDDKIVYKDRKGSEDIQEVDSFTSRVEKFKKMEGTGLHFEPATSKSRIDLISTTSPSLPIASYFDTGNYAAETHYLSVFHSLSSPVNAQMRIPPGFEEEYQRRLRNVIDPNKEDIYKDLSRVPDTSTQTRYIFSPTFSVPPSIQNITVTCAASRMSESIQESVIFTSSTRQTPVVTDITCDLSTDSAIKPFEHGQLSSTGETISSQIAQNIGPEENLEIQKLPEMESFFDNRRNLVTPNQNIISGANENDSTASSERLTENLMSQKLPEIAQFFDSRRDLESPNKNIISSASKTDFTASSERVKQSQTVTQFSSAFATENVLREKNSNTSMENKPLAQIIPERSQTHLPDPINFFSNVIPTETPEENTTSNRLASYFAHPVKTENQKSFFELSQGQDHFRHDSKARDSKKSTKFLTLIKIKYFLDQIKVRILT